MALRRLLVLDDDADFGEFIREIAVKMDFEVKVTTDGRTFQEVLPEFEPTTIVLDMVMPEIGGLDVVKWLVKRDYQAHLVIVTGYDPEYAAEAKKLGESKGLKSVTTLCKPVSVAVIRKVLSRTGDI